MLNIFLWKGIFSALIKIFWRVTTWSWISELYKHCYVIHIIYSKPKKKNYEIWNYIKLSIDRFYEKLHGEQLYTESFAKSRMDWKYKFIMLIKFPINPRLLRIVAHCIKLVYNIFFKQMKNINSLSHAWNYLKPLHWYVSYSEYTEIWKQCLCQELTAEIFQILSSHFIILRMESNVIVESQRRKGWANFLIF